MTTKAAECSCPASPPAAPGAHHRVRIFTPLRKLPFAGHPTLGSCHVWLKHNASKRDIEIIQQSAAGLVRIRRNGQDLAFCAPPVLRSGPLEVSTLERIKNALGLSAQQIQASQWVDNGPG